MNKMYNLLCFGRIFPAVSFSMYGTFFDGREFARTPGGILLFEQLILFIDRTLLVYFM